MADIQPATCPACGQAVDPVLGACPACGTEIRRRPVAERADPDGIDRPRRPRRLDDDDDYPGEGRHRRRRDIEKRPDDDEALSWIVPTRESLLAIAAGYCGLFACLLPFVGLVPALLGVGFGILALSNIRRNPGQRGAFRAWTGIVLGGLSLLVWGGTLLVIGVNAATR